MSQPVTINLTYNAEQEKESNRKCKKHDDDFYVMVQQ